MEIMDRQTFLTSSSKGLDPTDSAQDERNRPGTPLTSGTPIRMGWVATGVLISSFLHLSRSFLPQTPRGPLWSDGIGLLATCLMACCVAFVIHRIRISSRLKWTLDLGLFSLISRRVALLYLELDAMGLIAGPASLASGLNGYLRYGVLLTNTLFAGGIILTLVEIHNRNLALAEEMKSRERMEEECRRRLEESQELRRLESLGLLAGGIAHDFNNLLTRISGHVSLALDHLTFDSELKRNLEAVESCVAQGSRLSKQMLAYSGKGSFLVDPVNLTTLVRECEPKLREDCNQGPRIYFDLDPNLPLLDADPNQIRQLLFNLVTNAREATSPLGVIRVATGYEEVSAEKSGAPSTLDWSDRVYLEICDDGHGMTEEARRNLFEPFYSTRSTGRGLGMAAVQGIVRCHRGTIEIETEPGKGTRVLVAFPLHGNPLSQGTSRGPSAKKTETTDPSAPADPIPATGQRT
jgi:signal transduction histidine kinase